MACPITRTLTINFAPNGTPANGYRVKWRVVGTSSYTTATGPFTTSPITVSDVPACDNIEGTIEGDCDGTYSTAVNFSAPKVTPLVCGSNISRSYSGSSFYIYPKELIDLQGVTSSSILVNWTVGDVPNRINIYNSADELIATTGWKGTANYSGPWGATLSTNANGTLSFDKASGDGRYFTINAETVGDGTFSDNWQASISCTGGSGPTYFIQPSATSVNEGATVTWTVTTTGLGDTTLYYSLAGIQTADVSGGSLTGSVNIVNNTGTFTTTLVNDNLTEGAEVMTASLRTESVSGTVVATSVSVTVNDTSTTVTSAGTEINVVDSQYSYGTVNCLGTDYDTTINQTVVTLTDDNGTPVNATSNINVLVRYEYTNCLNQTVDDTVTITIPSGQSSASYTYEAITTVDCGQYGCGIESKSYSCAVSNSASLSFTQGVTVCAGT
jgi:hypothetical protein